MSVKEVITLLGGTVKIAKLLGIKSQAVSLWIRTNSIPLSRISALEKYSKEQNLPLRAEDMAPNYDWAVLREGQVWHRRQEHG